MLVDDKYILEMKNVTKSFPGVKALDNVSFNLKKGEVHAILGENGAGKSTLIKILTGIHQADSGKIFIKGKKANIKDANNAQTYHIAAIHQELCLVPSITVARNIFLGREVSGIFGLMDDEHMNHEAQKLFDSLGLNIKSEDIVSTYSIAQQQLVEIAKAISQNAEILIMDEPTSSLSDNEVQMLFRTIKRLKEQGTSIIYISHRLEELFEISDRVTVLRDGRYIDTKETSKTTRQELVYLMVGRELTQFYIKDSVSSEEVCLEVRNLTSKGVFSNISFNLRRGEILGVSGMVGSGRSEVARAIFGIDPFDSGEILLDGRSITIHSPKDAINNGIVLIPENRKEYGLVIVNSLCFNMTITILKRFLNFARWNRKIEGKFVQDQINALKIRAASHEQIVSSLSGGNQQKVVIAKWLLNNPRVIIMDEPTRGVDVGSKAEIYEIMNNLTKAGTSIIMISSDLPEIVNMSDRVAVLRQGRITGIIEKEEISQEKIISLAV
jgi:ABC-type sugar transport system ATPase subunit